MIHHPFPLECSKGYSVVSSPIIAVIAGIITTIILKRSKLTNKFKKIKHKNTKTINNKLNNQSRKS